MDNSAALENEVKVDLLHSYKFRWEKNFVGGLQNHKALDFLLPVSYNFVDELYSLDEYLVLCTRRKVKDL